MLRRLSRGSRLLAGVLLAAFLAFALPFGLSFSQTSADRAGVRARVAGDPDEAEAAPVELTVRAEALLATDRPWRAAQVMRQYRARVDETPPEHRVLAARAEAGWGNWPAVRALLDSLPALDVHGSGIGLYLLGRARDDAGDARGAVGAYRAFLALPLPPGELQEERDAARLHLGLALLRAGDREAGRRELRAAAAPLGGASAWLDVLEADALARAGDTLAVRQAVARFTSGLLGLRAWRARVMAARQAGDLAAARALANRARAWARTEDTRAEFMVEAARLALALGDTTAARSALRGVIDLDAAGPHARAASAMLQQGARSPADHLAIARVYRAQGLHEEALDGYRAWLASGEGTPAEQARVHLEYATALFYAERYALVEVALRPIASQRAAQLLRARAEAHLDRPEEAARRYLEVADQYRGTGNGAHALFLAAGTWHDAGDAVRARELYERVVREYAGREEMGLALMRLAGIAFLEGDYAEAVRLWDRYRAGYPRGALALQATYWAGRAREAMGDTTSAHALYRAVRQRARDSYYALLASERLGEPFWPLPMGPSPPESPAAAQRVAGWMRGVDLLREAGFPEEASAEADRVVASAGGDVPTLYVLGEALVARGYAQRAIQIGLRLQANQPKNRRLLRLLYPFPYRTLLTEEARERRIDPFIPAALIRQESMFEARATSHVGARGLMQIMPATGRRLAEAVDLSAWDPEVLYHPEINVHLGTRYVAQFLGDYEGALPPVFSAYNAGPHRVAWWRRFPEYGDDELFTERVPFRETRDYVKILTRNHAIYRGLYGDEG